MANKIISGCRRVTLNCALKFAKKKKKMKRSSALSTLQNGSFRKGTLRFSFFFSSILLERINLKLLTSE